MPLPFQVCHVSLFYWVHQPQPATVVHITRRFDNSSFQFPAVLGSADRHGKKLGTQRLGFEPTPSKPSDDHPRSRGTRDIIIFTATITLALYALTAIFTVSLFSNFFPDQDNIRNVEWYDDDDDDDYYDY